MICQRLTLSWRHLGVIINQVSMWQRTSLLNLTVAELSAVKQRQSPRTTEWFSNKNHRVPLSHASSISSWEAKKSLAHSSSFPSLWLCLLNLPDTAWHMTSTFDMTEAGPDFDFVAPSTCGCWLPEFQHCISFGRDYERVEGQCAAFDNQLRSR